MNALEYQCAQGSLMRAAFSPLLLVKSACPKRFINGLRSPFNKRLPHKLWTPQSPMYPAFLTASFKNRRNTRIHLQFTGSCIAFTLLTKGGKQAWRQSLTGPRQITEKHIVRQCRRERRNLLVKPINGLQRNAYLLDQHLRQRCDVITATSWVNDCERFDRFDSRGNERGGTQVMRLEKGFQHRLACICVGQRVTKSQNRIVSR